MLRARTRFPGTVTLVVAMTLAGCAGQDDVATPVTTTIVSDSSIRTSSTATPHPETTEARATTTTAVLPPATTPIAVIPAPASIFPPVRGVFAPPSGWIVSESPYTVGMAFWGTPSPGSVTINGEALVAEDATGQVFWSPPIHLAPGVNQLHLVVEYLGQIVEEAEIPVTYLPGAEHRLGWIAAAAEDSITVGFTDWDDDQEFPGPEDPDPGVLSVVPVGEQVRVVVSEEIDVDYDWLEAEVNNGYTNREGLPGLDDWNPSGVYPYVLTIHNGEVVQIWRVPLG